MAAPCFLAPIAPGSRAARALPLAAGRGSVRGADAPGLRARGVRAVARRAETSGASAAGRPGEGGVVLVAGKFDAFHVGHRALVRAAAGLGAPTLLSFSGMAAALRWPPRAPVVAPLERARILREWGFALSASVGFRSVRFGDIRDMPPDAFLAYAQDALGASAVVCGADWRFGAGAAGDVPLLRALAAKRGLHACVVPPVMHAGEPVSSTRVRAAIAAGDVELAALLMDRPHRLVGVVSDLTADSVACRDFINQVPGEGMYSALIRVIGAAQPVRSYVQVAYPQLTVTAEEGPAVQKTAAAPLVTIYDATQIYCDDCEVYIDFTARVR